MPSHALTIAQQSDGARAFRRCGNKNPHRYHRVVERTPAPSDALKAALDAVEAFGKTPAYKRHKASRRGVAHA